MNKMDMSKGSMMRRDVIVNSNISESQKKSFFWYGFLSLSGCIFWGAYGLID